MCKLQIVFFLMKISCSRCRESVDFSLKCSWLLDAYSSDAALSSKKKSHGTELRNRILSGKLGLVYVIIDLIDATLVFDFKVITCYFDYQSLLLLRL